MDNLAIIIARGGSVGLPGKNALPVAGRAMLDWTFDHALGSKRLDHVAFSTDSELFMPIAQARGIETIDRPAELATNHATVDSAARHAVETLEARHGQTCQRVAILYGNIPVRPTDLTDRALEKLIDTEADSVQSVGPVEKNHPYWMKRVEGDRLLMYEDNHVYRRQDLPPVYMLDGGVIAVTRQSLFNVVEGQPHAFLGQDRRAIVTGPGEVVDVDSQTDLYLADAVLRTMGGAIAHRPQASGAA